MNTTISNLIMKPLQKLIVCSIIFPIPGIALSAAPDINAGLVYLSVVATEIESIDAIKQYPALSKQFKDLKVISSSDCRNLKPDLILYVSKISSDKQVTKKALKLAKTLIPDAYFKKCNVKENSLLSSHYALIHYSIFNLPDDTINWSFDDMKSQLLPFNKSISFLIEKRLNIGKSVDANGEAEGRQSAIYLINKKSANKHLITEQCWDFLATDQNKQLIAFQCMTGIAANHYIHTVYIYNTKTNSIVFNKPYCQQAKFINSTLVTCSEESVDEMGELKLLPVNLPIN